MTISRRVFLGGSTAIATVAASQLARMGSSVAQSDRVLNLYSARHYDTDSALYEGFTQKTGIKVNLIEADAAKLIERIKSESAASPADVLITVDAGNLWRAREAGILQPVRSRLLQTSIPVNLRDPGGYWFGLSRRARVIVYNKEKVKPSDLTTYEALADGKWKGRILIRSSSNVYNQSLTGSILHAHGEQKTEDWAKGLVANFARNPEGNDTAQIKAAAAGVGDIAIANTYYMVRLAKSSKPEEKAIAAKLGVFFPNQRDRGAHVNICGGGVVKTARNPEAALKFLEYLVSREAQQIFASGNNEYPVVKGVALDPVLASFGSFKSDLMDAAVFGKNNAAALKIMDRAGWR
ncbi:Fe(3+) ABC transporter substrate-binding protein [Leptolyngbya sp. 'hensonii']|uniref:Fe(3+) ABC transporter substrate-binding protein n=1 Tax=Leptolyngbya sp. 'hensonii' TaxID=1922337 RepID=UPI00094F9314|nr:Fe(3+) ABC transporter substrate-binding protein [Leptolyngbya sp. 'hensonii']OLP16077.1 Fe(3+) ABC transporter substrate-binding protein [Leptolyngbya sp. 'hensonii']